MNPVTGSGFEPRLQPSPAIPAGRRELTPVERREPPTPINGPLSSARSGPERLSPKLRRVYSAGQLLFQVVGAAGYAGYFASMHTFLRVFSGALMAGAWYAIYRVKGAGRP